jgi:hypothetical protein
VRDVELLRADLAGQPDRDLRVEPPVDRAPAGRIRRREAPARLAVPLRDERDEMKES